MLTELHELSKARLLWAAKGAHVLLALRTRLVFPDSSGPGPPNQINPRRAANKREEEQHEHEKLLSGKHSEQANKQTTKPADN